jgi:hypothetical protein
MEAFKGQWLRRPGGDFPIDSFVTPNTLRERFAA